MKAFVLVTFWLTVMGFVIRCVFILLDEYPRETTKGGDIVSNLVGMGFVLWAAYLLWG